MDFKHRERVNKFPIYEFIFISVPPLPQYVFMAWRLISEYLGLFPGGKAAGASCWSLISI
jgi:hypothetical protein